MPIDTAAAVTLAEPISMSLGGLVSAAERLYPFLGGAGLIIVFLSFMFKDAIRAFLSNRAQGREIIMQKIDEVRLLIEQHVREERAVWDAKDKEIAEHDEKLAELSSASRVSSEQHQSLLTLIQGISTQINTLTGAVLNHRSGL